MIRFLLALFLAGSAYSQFSGLAPTDDGSQVYFVTDLRLASESVLNLPPTTAIYRWNATGSFERIAGPPDFLPGFQVYYSNPQVSGDGKVVSYTVSDSCNGGSSCLSHPPISDSHVSIDGQPYDLPVGGSAQISRNGRYVFNLRHMAIVKRKGDV